MGYNEFTKRHIGPRETELNEMLQEVGVSSLDELIDQTVPANIRMQRELELSKSMTEHEYAQHIDSLASKNRLFKTYIGLGYHDTITPAPIKRNVLENPGWYTAYTPYQAEIAQGRMEALLNFQTMVMDLTGMELANASLLDEATAAAEAMSMFYATMSRKAQKAGINKFFVSEACFPQTIALIETRANPLGFEVVVGNHLETDLSDGYFGALLQYPMVNGEVVDYTDFITAAHANEVKVCIAADIMSLAMLKSPGSMGADCVVGNTQRFGVPMGYGGPHAAYFATREDYKRHIPGRIIGVSKDVDGNPAFRMALQTREQHIRRDKATSNICTAQALLAVMASFYAVYHGKEGIQAIAGSIHSHTQKLHAGLSALGCEVVNDTFFDTVTVSLAPKNLARLKAIAEGEFLNFRYTDSVFGISINETTTTADVQDIINVVAKAMGVDPSFDITKTSGIPADLARDTDFFVHDVFHLYHSETELMRYIKRLENRDMSLTHSMISLGSCTMKLNAASELIPISHPKFAGLHPFIPMEQASGMIELIEKLGKDLADITGFDGVSFQPNSGAQGEYAGLMVIKAYHEANGDHHRNICLIPSSAHGTNPASAVMAGMKVVVVACDEQGNIDVDDLRAKATEHANELSALMVTYPSTHGVYEASIREITDIVHENGGQVYMDGANMNAQVGLTSPGLIGADVCHLNLHKTFAIPHGGGGPGMGPIGVKQHLTPFLPAHPLIATGGADGISPVSAAPFGSALILLISYGYIRMLGKSGVTESTRIAILNANYIKEKLNNEFDVLYKGENGRIAHEMIVDCRAFKKTAGIEVEDIAKRLIDFGFHAPTVSFPVAGTVMVEPTESESKQELDRFVEAMKAIRAEIQEIENGVSDTENNPLKNAPHTAKLVTADEWNLPYTRQQAAYPLPYVMDAKFWPHVRRVDNAYGDRNLICSCLPLEAYA